MESDQSNINSKISKVIEKYSSNKVKLMVENALKRGLNLDNPIDSHKNSLLHLCVIYDLDEHLHKLLQCGADPLVFDVHGFSPLDIAIAIGNQILFQQLMRRVEFSRYVRVYLDDGMRNSLQNIDFDEGCIPFVVGAIYEDYVDWTPSVKAQHLKELAESMQSYVRKLEQDIQSVENKRIGSEKQLKELYINLVNKEHDICNSILVRIQQEKEFRDLLSSISEEITHAKNLLTIIDQTVYWTGNVQIRRYKGIVYEHWKAVKLIVSGSVLRVLFNASDDDIKNDNDKKTKKDILIPLGDLSKVVISKSGKGSSLEKSITIQYKKVKKDSSDKQHTATSHNIELDSAAKKVHGYNTMSDKNAMDGSLESQAPIYLREENTSKHYSKGVHSLHIRVLPTKHTKPVITSSVPSVDTLAHVIKLLHDKVEVVCNINGAVVEYEVGEKDIAIYQMLRQSSLGFKANQNTSSPMPEMVNRILHKMSVDLGEKLEFESNGVIELQPKQPSPQATKNEAPQNTRNSSSMRSGQSMSISASSGCTSMESVSSIASAIQGKKSPLVNSSIKKQDLQLRFEDSDAGSGKSVQSPTDGSVKSRDPRDRNSSSYQFQPFNNPLEVVEEDVNDKKSSIDSNENNSSQTAALETVDTVNNGPTMADNRMSSSTFRDSEATSKYYSAKLVSVDIVKDINHVPHVHMILLSSREEREQLTNKLISSITNREKLLEELHYIHALRDIIRRPPLIPTRTFALYSNADTQSVASGMVTPARKEFTDLQTDLEKYINSLLDSHKHPADIAITPYCNIHNSHSNPLHSIYRTCSTSSYKTPMKSASKHSSAYSQADMESERESIATVHTGVAFNNAANSSYYDEMSRLSLFEETINSLARASFSSEMNAMHHMQSPKPANYITNKGFLGLPPPQIRPQFEKLMEELVMLWSCDISKFENREKISDASRVLEETLQKLVKMHIEENAPNVTKEDELVEVEI